mmetsp:Transcript_144684/g.449215  ORF Transcript_144684/g.449215 Transcript_144684/m.449215 type:complete len:257 (-) Transcript_144684:7-777(-)
MLWLTGSTPSRSAPTPEAVKRLPRPPHPLPGGHRWRLLSSCRQPVRRHVRAGADRDKLLRGGPDSSRRRRSRRRGGRRLGRALRVGIQIGIRLGKADGAASTGKARRRGWPTQRVERRRAEAPTRTTTRGPGGRPCRSRGVPAGAVALLGPELEHALHAFRCASACLCCCCPRMVSPAPCGHRGAACARRGEVGYGDLGAENACVLACTVSSSKLTLAVVLDARLGWQGPCRFMYSLDHMMKYSVWYSLRTGKACI